MQILENVYDYRSRNVNNEELIIMRTRTQTVKIIALAIALSGLLIVPAYAISENAGGTNSQSEQSNQGSQSDQSNQSESAGSGKLDDNKKKICQQNEVRMQNMFTNMNQLGEGQLNLFDKIAERLRAYYTDSGLSIENYQELVDQVEQLRLEAQAAVQATVQTSSQFGCDKDDPKGTASQYKVQIKTQMEALKEYRVAIKNLLSAIQTAAQTSSQEGQE